MLFKVGGMTCASCVARVEKAARSVNGVLRVEVSLLTNSMKVEGDFLPGQIEKAVSKAGYSAKLSDEKEVFRNNQTPENEKTKLKFRLISSAVILVFLMYFSMGVNMLHFPLPAFLSDRYVALIQLVLSLCVMVINRAFFINGIKGLIHLSPNMDSLVCIGSGVSFIYSAVQTLAAMMNGKTDGLLHGLYFDSAAMILFLITVGKTLEARSKLKTADALNGLTSLAPEKAVIIENGIEKEVPIENVKVGDVFVCKSGQAFSLDGYIKEGECSVDESYLTGESLPVDKKTGDKVFCGTKNLSGYVLCVAEKTTSETMLSRIISRVRDASSTKAPISKLADRVSAFFVPAVMAVSLLTFVIWMLVGESFSFSLTKAISVLVISCPCSLGLATPVAVMVGSGVGAKNGILFKSASILENMGKTSVIALDKTGTLTKGCPEVYEICSENKDELCEIALSLEKKSEHPLALAVVSYCIENGIKEIECHNVKTHTGNGITGETDGNFCAGGNEKFISGFAAIPENYLEFAKISSENGMTPLFFSKENECLGVICVSDMLKDDAKLAIKRLTDSEIRVIMITGDNENVAKSISSAVGIKEYHSSVLPEHKADIIEKLKKSGKVAMTGDGINDAVALECADTGIAVGSGADVAIDSADVVLLNNRLLDVYNALKISKRTMKIIKQNLFWAFFYNAVCIPIAAGVLTMPLGISITPAFSALAMSLSSFFVVSNSLRINLFSPERFLKENEAILSVGGMMCSHCEKAVKEALEKLDGIKRADASYLRNEVGIIFEKELSEKEIKSAVKSAGYKYKKLIKGERQ